MTMDVQQSICIVKCGDTYGTAFLLSNTIAVTAYHVVIGVEEGKPIELKFTNSGNTIEADFIISDDKYKKLDIALLSIKESITMEKFLTPVIRPVFIKQKWYSRGYPRAKSELGENLVSSDNIINQIFDSPQRGKFDIQLDASLKFDSYEGLSGAPLIIDGTLAGLINTQFDENGIARELYALSLNYFKDLLVDNGIHVNCLSELAVKGQHGGLEVSEDTHLFNFLLNRTLVEAISKTDESAKRVFISMQQVDIEKVSQYRFVEARKYIEESFFAVFGVQKLMEIGKVAMESHNSIASQKYLDQSMCIVKNILRFSCFVLLSELWNVKGAEEARAVKYTEFQRSNLEAFFDYRFDADIIMDFELLVSLLDIFFENELSYPIPDYLELRSCINNDPSIRAALFYLKDLADQIIKSPSLSHCCEVEKRLCVFLSHFWFMTRYRMISVKGLRYDRMYKDDGYFIHKYYQLVPKNSKQDTRGCEKAEITTDSIVVYEQDYKNGINLFPFLIDINALMFEGESKIYFFNKTSSEGDCLEYLFIDNYKSNKCIPAGFSGNRTDINVVIKDKEAHQRYKFDKVHAQFVIAKSAILS